MMEASKNLLEEYQKSSYNTQIRVGAEFCTENTEVLDEERLFGARR